jgi:hypothetical protein
MGFFDKLLSDEKLPPALRERKAREARVLKEQFARSKFGEAAAASRDKRFTATDAVLAPQADSLFPDLPLLAVGGGGARSTLHARLARGGPAGCATLVTLAFQGRGQAQLPAWHGALLEARERGAARGLALLNVLLLQGWFWRAAEGVVARSSARALHPEVARDTHLSVHVSAMEVDHLADRLRVHNRMMGWAFLVDGSGLVRWRAHGEPREGEADAMLRAAATLVITSSGSGAAARN